VVSEPECDPCCYGKDGEFLERKPIFHVLEGLVVNAHHLKAVPGRQTDLKDAEWIADLVQHGLLRPSFVPPAFQRERRELTRYRTSVIEERSRTINRLPKMLEDTTIRLSAVASDLMGQCARQMLAA
jgi:transposase